MCLGKISILVAIWFWKHLASHTNCQVPIPKKPVSARQPVSQAAHASSPWGDHGSLKTSVPTADGGLGGRHSQGSGSSSPGSRVVQNLEKQTQVHLSAPPPTPPHCPSQQWRSQEGCLVSMAAGRTADTYKKQWEHIKKGILLKPFSSFPPAQRCMFTAFLDQCHTISYSSGPITFLPTVFNPCSPPCSLLSTRGFSSLCSCPFSYWTIGPWGWSLHHSVHCQHRPESLAQSGFSAKLTPDPKGAMEKGSSLHSWQALPLSLTSDDDVSLSPKISRDNVISSREGCAGISPTPSLLVHEALDLYVGNYLLPWDNASHAVTQERH